MRVLVVEDEQRLAAALRSGLEAEGLAVDVAHDGIDGLWLAREMPYDAIVLDILLPGMGGYQVCAALRAAQIWTPILILTAKDGEWDEVDGLDTGADDYLTKPFSYAVLMARLRALFRRGAHPRPAVLSVGAVRLDPAQRRVWLTETDNDNQVEVELTAREHALLEFLMRRADEVVSKRDILDHVWDVDFDGDPNIVEVYVSRLRAKLGSARIQTRRGAGYQVVPGAG
ncbi:response regulator transcription factor [Actinophytocola sp.]|uniref:response regulator transcription factor n=1 Tax=Actinophytocola sp. TaxID=1872138 RepID=UPI002EDB40B4